MVGRHREGGDMTPKSGPSVDSETIDAVGKASEALEYVERARGHLYAFHQLIGRARNPAGIVRGIVVCSLTFLVSNSVFAVMYTGV